MLKFIRGTLFCPAQGCLQPFDMPPPIAEPHSARPSRLAAREQQDPTERLTVPSPRSKHSSPEPATSRGTLERLRTSYNVVYAVARPGTSS